MIVLLHISGIILVMNNKYQTLNHAKFKIRYHIIFSTKYRKKCLKPIIEDIKSYMKLAESKQNELEIEAMGIDAVKPDHMHLMIKSTPKCKVEDIVHSLKQTSTFCAWKNHHDYLSGFYWSGKHYLWTRGYFCTSIGDVSSSTLKEYIEKQG